MKSSYNVIEKNLKETRKKKKKSCSSLLISTTQSTSLMKMRIGNILESPIKEKNLQFCTAMPNLDTINSVAKTTQELNGVDIDTYK